MAVDLSQLKTLTQYKGAETDLQLFATEGQATVDGYAVEFGEISQATQDRIALYLAGHFYVVSMETGGKSYKKTGESEERYRVPASDKVGFQSTRFGQQACALDATGTLITASMSTSGRAEFVVLNSSERSSTNGY